MADFEVIYGEQNRHLVCGDRFVRSWIPHPRADSPSSSASSTQGETALAIVHGLGDHSGRFDRMARWFAGRGVCVYGFDLIGHGNSPGDRMVILNYDAMLREIESFLDYIRVEQPGARLGLFGQSMGGNLVLNHQLRGYSSVSFAIAGSPMLRAVNRPGAISLFLFRLLSYVHPHHRLIGDADASTLSRDLEMQRAFEDDPLVQRGITLRLARVLIDAGEWALKSADQLETPTLVTHGSDDRITCHKASLEFAERSQGKAITKIWPGGKHDLHHDIVRDDYFATLADWIETVAAS